MTSNDYLFCYLDLNDPDDLETINDKLGFIKREPVVYETDTVFCIRGSD